MCYFELQIKYSRALQNTSDLMSFMVITLTVFKVPYGSHAIIAKQQIYQHKSVLFLLGIEINSNSDV